MKKCFFYGCEQSPKFCYLTKLSIKLGEFSETILQDLEKIDTLERISRIRNTIHAMLRVEQNPKFQVLSSNTTGIYFPFDIFREICSKGIFSEHENRGFYCDGTSISNVRIFPSDFIIGIYRTDFTHVYWITAD